MRTLTLAGVRLDVFEADWNAATRPATMIVRVRNSKVVLERLTTALRSAHVHAAEAGPFTATVSVGSVQTDKHKITLHIQPVEPARQKMAG